MRRERFPGARSGAGWRTHSACRRRVGEVDLRLWAKSNRAVAARHLPARLDARKPKLTMSLNPIPLHAVLLLELE